MHEAYKELEKLLFRGFLQSVLSIDGVTVTIRTITPREDESIEEWGNLYADNEFERESIRVAFHLFKIDAFYLLKIRDDEEKFRDLINWVRDLPVPFLTKILEEIGRLTYREIVVGSYLSPYLYEDRSRSKWSVYKNHFLMDPKLTGYAGTELLGLNQYQEEWIEFNVKEDEKTQYEDLYGLAKFLGCFINPEAGKKAWEEDEKRKDWENYKRSEFKKGRIVKSLEFDGESSEDLVKELHRQMSGEKDWHDLLIEEYESTLAEQYNYEEGDRVIQEISTRTVSEEEFIHLLESQSRNLAADLPDPFVYDKEDNPIYGERQEQLVRKITGRTNPKGPQREESHGEPVYRSHIDREIFLGE